MMGFENQVGSSKTALGRTIDTGMGVLLPNTEKIVAENTTFVLFAHVPARVIEVVSEMVTEGKFNGRNLTVYYEAPGGGIILRDLINRIWTHLANSPSEQEFENRFSNICQGLAQSFSVNAEQVRDIMQMDYTFALVQQLRQLKEVKKVGDIKLESFDYNDEQAQTFKFEEKSDILGQAALAFRDLLRADFIRFTSAEQLSSTFLSIAALYVDGLTKLFADCKLRDKLNTEFLVEKLTQPAQDSTRVVFMGTSHFPSLQPFLLSDENTVWLPYPRLFQDLLNSERVDNRFILSTAADLTVVRKIYDGDEISLDDLKVIILSNSLEFTLSHIACSAEESGSLRPQFSFLTERGVRMHIASTIVGQMTKLQKEQLFGELINLDRNIKYSDDRVENHLVYRTTFFLECMFSTKFDSAKDGNSFFKNILSKCYPLAGSVI